MARFARAPTVWKGVLIAALAATFLWYADLGAIRPYLRSDALLMVGLVQPIVFIGYWCAARKFSALVSSPPLPTAISLKAVLLSYGANIVLPGRISEVLKATYLRDQKSIPLSTGLAALVLDRSLDLAIVAVAAIVVVGVLVVPVSAGWIALGPIVLLALVLLPKVRPLADAIARHLPFKVVREFTEQTIRHASARVEDRAIYGALLFGVLTWLAAAVGVLVLLNALGSIRIGFVEALAVLLLAGIGGAIPALPAGLGTYEAGAVLVLSGLGCSLEEALWLALTLHASQLLIPAAGASIVAATERVGIASAIHEARRLMAGKSSVSDPPR